MQPVNERPQLPQDLRSLVPQLQSVLGQYGYAINRIIDEPLFIAASLENSWVDYDTSIFAGAGYYKDAFGRVHLRGLVKSGTISTTIFTLPEGYRPSLRLIFPSLQYNGVAEVIARINVLANGQVTQENLVGTTDGNDYLSLNGISFAAV